MSAIVSIGGLVGGVAAGVLLNDIWEGAVTQGVPLPGYGMTLLDLGKTNNDQPIKLGGDDVLQASVGVGLVAFGQAVNPILRNVGIGIVIGTALAKMGEFMEQVPHTDALGNYFRNPISLIPHRYPIMPSLATPLTDSTPSGAFNANIAQ